MLAIEFLIQKLEKFAWAFIEIPLFLYTSVTYKIEYEVKSSTSISILLGKFTGLVLVDDHHGLFLASMRTFPREETARKQHSNHSHCVLDDDQKIAISVQMKIIIFYKMCFIQFHFQHAMNLQCRF